MRSRRTFVCVTSTPHFSMLEALVFAAKTLVILDWTEDLRAKKAITLGLERSVVDRFGLFHFAERPGLDHLRRCETDPDQIEILDYIVLLEQLQ
jgi:hypothetical protein